MPILIVYIVVGVIFAVIGAKMARSRQRDPAIWAVICFLFPLIGVLALALAGSASGASVGGDMSADLGKKWSVLVELDPEIRAAAERVRAKGMRYEALLAQKYMAINDKAYLKAAEDAVHKQAEEDEVNSRAGLQAHQSALERHNQAKARYRVALQIGLFTIVTGLPAYFALDVMGPRFNAIWYLWLVLLGAYSAFVGFRGINLADLIQVGAGVAVGMSIVISIFLLWFRVQYGFSIGFSGFMGALGSSIPAAMIVVVAAAAGGSKLGPLLIRKTRS